jgi:hypothetical protein
MIQMNQIGNGIKGSFHAIREDGQLPILGCRAVAEAQGNVLVEIIAYRRKPNMTDSARLQLLEKGDEDKTV